MKNKCENPKCTITGKKNIYINKINKTLEQKCQSKVQLFYLFIFLLFI